MLNLSFLKREKFYQPLNRAEHATEASVPLVSASVGQRGDLIADRFLCLVEPIHIWLITRNEDAPYLSINH